MVVGIFSPGKSRWPSIGLGILVLIFAAIAMSFPVAAAITIVVFSAIAFYNIEPEEFLAIYT